MGSNTQCLEGPAIVAHHTLFWIGRSTHLTMSLFAKTISCRAQLRISPTNSPRQLQQLLTNCVYDESWHKSKMSGNLKHRRAMDLIGVSRNPEYIIGTYSSSFHKTEDGKRLAPVSQLNTSTGRMFARKPSQKGDVRAKPPGASKEEQPIPLFGKNTPQRGLPSPQKPRTELSQLVGMTRGSSRKGTTQGQKEAKTPDTEACNAAAQFAILVVPLRPNKSLSFVPAAESAELMRSNAIRRKNSSETISSTRGDDVDPLKSSSLDLWEQAGMSESKARPFSFDDDSDTSDEEVLVMLDTTSPPKRSNRRRSQAC